MIYEHDSAAGVAWIVLTLFVAGLVITALVGWRAGWWL